jgi:hypothetical protein
MKEKRRMRKLLVLFALVGLFALSAVAMGSRPTKQKQTVSTLQTAVIGSTNISTVAKTHTISAVNSAEAQARTVETARPDADDYMQTAANVGVLPNHQLAVQRQSTSPPERLQGNAERYATLNKERDALTDNVSVGYVPRR